MNFGFNGFPTQTSNIIGITEFDYTGTYIIPKNTKALSIYLVGAGGGAGGGRNSALGTAAYGAGGGGGGVTIQGYFTLAHLGLSENDGLLVVIGKGGSGGTGSSVSNTNGTTGTAGGASRIYRLNNSFNVATSNFQGILLQATGGSASGGATNTAGFGAGNNSNNINGISVSGNFAPSGINTSSGFTGIPNVLNYALNGLGGGGIDTAGVASHSGKARTLSTATGFLQTNPLLAQSFIEFGFVNAQTNGLSSQEVMLGATMWGGKYGYGWFGGGGGGGSTANAGNGGEGWRGSGGGGGGGCLAGFKAGDGGKGGNGYCLIVAHA